MAVEEAGREERSFSSGEACRFAGINYGQLRYWAGTGLVVPSLSSGLAQRRYSWQGVLALRMVAHLRGRGLPLQALRRSVEYLRANLPEVEKPLAELTLVTDGRNLFAICRSPEETAVRVIDALRGGQLVMAIALGEFQAEGAAVEPEAIPN